MTPAALTVLICLVGAVVLAAASARLRAIAVHTDDYTIDRHGSVGIFTEQTRASDAGFLAAHQAVASRLRSASTVAGVLAVLILVAGFASVWVRVPWMYSALGSLVVVLIALLVMRNLWSGAVKRANRVAASTPAE